jgi:UDP-4-keto-D-FucNAc 4-reductase
LVGERGLKKTLHITGASGFIGSVLSETLSKDFAIQSSGRSKTPANKNPDYMSIDWSSPINGADSIFKNVYAVVHCAGLAHETNVMSSYEDYLDANVTAAVNVFIEAKRSGVRKFLFLSSVSVFDTSEALVTIDDMTVPSPINDYGKTKYIAELELTELAENSDVELTIVRIPMVIGASAPGNLKSLLRLIKFPIPFPLIAKPKQRSFITVKSLSEYCDIILKRSEKHSITTVNLANTPAITVLELVRGIRCGLEVRNFIILLPEKVLFFFLYILGRKLLFNKIYGGLVVKPSIKALEVGWNPEVEWGGELYEVGVNSKGKKIDTN